VSGLVRRCRVIIIKGSARSDLCRGLFGEVGLLSNRVRSGRLGVGTCSVRWIIVGTCPARSALCRYMSAEDGLMTGRFRRGRVSVGTCSAGSVYGWDVFGVVGLGSGRVRRCRVSVRTCSAMSA